MVVVAMVTSEMGARLSPKIAPERIAPARIAGWLPSRIPAGYRMGNTVVRVPMEEPVAVVIRQAARNVKAVKMLPGIPTMCAIQTKPWDTPLMAISLVNIPMTSRITTILTEVELPIPRSTASQ